MKKAKFLLGALAVLAVGGATAGVIAHKKNVPLTFYTSAVPTLHATATFTGTFGDVAPTNPYYYYTTVFSGNASISTYFSTIEE